MDLEKALEKEAFVYSLIKTVTGESRRLVIQDALVTSFLAHTAGKNIDGLNSVLTLACQFVNTSKKRLESDPSYLKIMQNCELNCNNCGLGCPSNTEGENK